MSLVNVYMCSMVVKQKGIVWSKGDGYIEKGRGSIGKGVS
jgi:hypothetical protein